MLLRKRQHHANKRKKNKRKLYLLKIHFFVQICDRYWNNLDVFYIIVIFESKHLFIIFEKKSIFYSLNVPLTKYLYFLNFTILEQKCEALHIRKR